MKLMKTRSAFILSITLVLAVLASCRTPLNDDFAVGGGTLSLSVSAIAPWILAAGEAPGESSAARAFAYATSAQVTVTSSDGAVVVDHAAVTISGSLDSGTARVENIPVGVGYTVTVDIYNSAASPQPVVSGSAGGVAFHEGETTQVAIRCLPVDPSTLELDTTVQHSVNPKGEVWYSLAVEADTVYAISQSGEGLLIGVFDASGALLSGDYSASPSFFHQAAAAQTLYIAVVGGSNTESVTGSLRATASETDISSFKLNLPGAYGVIDETSGTITVTLPWGTDLANEDLIASFAITGVRAEVDGVIQTSGESAHNFSAPVSYTVYAADGREKTYTVNAVIGPLLFSYTQVDGQATITGLSSEWTNLADTDRRKLELRVPAAIAGCPVAVIAYQAFAANALIEEVELPATVVEVGENAFHDCASLKRVSIPGAAAIGAAAFGACFSLESVWMPETVSLGAEAFGHCIQLKGLELPNVTSVGDSAFSGCTGLEAIAIPKLQSLGDIAFAGCGSLSAIDLAEGLTLIGRGTFADCGALASVTLPPTLQSIGDEAFQNCAVLSGLTFPATLAAIGASAFQNCAGLTELALPASLTAIGEHAFDNCTGLTSLQLNEGLESLGDYAFHDCSSLGQVAIPVSLTYFGDRAFASCDGLTEIVLPEGLTVLGASAFSWVNHLPAVTLPSTLAVIPDNAFEFCQGLTSVTISEGIQAIGSGAFSFCVSLETIALPASVTTIGRAAFARCDSLDEVSLSTGLETLSESIFSCCSALESLTIPASVNFISQAFPECDNLASLTVLAATPPTLDTTISYGVVTAINNLIALRDNYALQAIYVHYDSLDAYKSAWSGVADIIQARPETIPPEPPV